MKLPPSGNTGGKVRSESHPVLVDWLSVSLPVDAIELDDLAFALRELLPSAGGLVPRGRGLHGYERSWAFEVGGGLVATGGNGWTHYVDLPARACELVEHWPTLREFLTHHSARITRVDLACDVFDGSRSLDDACRLVLAGAFSSGGRPPSISQAGNWLAPDGSGRTLYVGKGKNGKLLRVYEKGKQLGQPESPWVRWEVQLRAVDRGIPHDVVTDPRTYLAGAYPALDWVGEASRIKTLAAVDGIVLASLVEHARSQYGRLVDVLVARDCSPSDIVARLRRPGVPSRLGRAGKVFDGVVSEGLSDD